LLGYDRVLEKRSGGPGKSWKNPGFFCKQETGNPVTAWVLSFLIHGVGFHITFRKLTNFCLLMVTTKSPVFPISIR